MKTVILAALVALSVPAMADEMGIATYYSFPGHHGLYAAHKYLPFGTRVMVHNLDNGRAIEVTIIDRGPFAPGRIIDLGTEAAAAIGILRVGIAHVRLERVREK